VVLTRDRHLTREGFGDGDWLTTMLLLRRLAELDTMFYGGSRFIWLFCIRLPGLGLTRLIRRLAQSRIALGFVLGLIVGSVLWLREQLRSVDANAWARAVPVLEQTTEGMVSALEGRARTDEALQARLVLPALAPGAESAAARLLAERGERMPSEQIHAELVERGHDISLSATRRMLGAHPSFVGTPGRGFELGWVLRGPDANATQT
jgi:hypothetical protein